MRTSHREENDNLISYLFHLNMVGFHFLRVQLTDEI